MKIFGKRESISRHCSFVPFQNRKGLLYAKLCCMLMVCMLFLGCGGKERQKADYQKIADDYAALILQEDADSRDYEEALQAVGDYLEQKEESRKKEAVKIVKDTITYMEEDYGQIKSYTMEESFQGLLKKYQIEPEEYLMFANERKEELFDYQTTLMALEEYLDEENGTAASLEALEQEYEMAVKMQEVMKGYQYCGINYWFAGWEEEAADYVKEQVYDKLTSFSAEGEVWQDSREAVEERMTQYLDRLEELVNEWSGYLGEKQEKLYEQEKEN